MRTIDIGRLNKRVTFLKMGKARDSMGQTTQELQEIKTVWASLYPIRGAEYYENQKIQGKVTHKCYVRYLADVDSNCYLEHKGKIYSIESALDVDMAHKMLEIMCCEYTNKEKVRDARADAGSRG